jgi:hypothetical protein
VKALIVFLLLPVCLKAQESRPVISDDYLDLIKENPSNYFFSDSTNSIKNPSLKLSTHYNGFTAKKIKIKDSLIIIQPANSKTLLISGNFNSTIEIKKTNAFPRLQSRYVQGRLGNGILNWRGPETGELFSYGPDITMLEFDGSNYRYDINGKLIANTSSNGKKVIAYPNTIFRTGNLFSQSFNIQGKYRVKGKEVLNSNLNMGYAKENTFINYNSNSNSHISSAVEALIKWLTISASFRSSGDKFSNNNRNGFLNRVYQNALLTPISFDNVQNSLLPTGQRAYSNNADNPLFLLQHNLNSFHQSDKLGSLLFEKKNDKLRFKLLQKLEWRNQVSNEGYEPSTAFFTNGIFTSRQQQSQNYLLKANAAYDIPYESDYLKSSVLVNYIFTDAHSAIKYKPGRSYNYQRSSHDFSLSTSTNYHSYRLEAGLNFGNKFYSSNTATFSDFFLPDVSGFINYGRLADNNVSIKLVGAYNNFNSELPINASFSQNNLLNYSTEQAFQYFPVLEVNSFGLLSPIRNKEWKTRLEIDYKYRISFYAEFFQRKTFDDVFPVHENNQLLLKSLADHSNKGIELGLGFSSYKRNFNTIHNLAFFSHCRF